MKRSILIYFIIILIAPSCRGERSGTEVLKSENVRKPVFAGQFYPADPKVLGNALKSFLDQAKKPGTVNQSNNFDHTQKPGMNTESRINEESEINTKSGINAKAGINAKPGINTGANDRAGNDIIAIIVPHAGYVFSGQITADAFSQVRNNHYDLIAVLGTNHTSADFTGISIYSKGAFGTPIGDAQIDEAAAEELLKEDASFTTNADVHAKEHSIEVQIPFIKYLFPDAKILPVIVSGTETGIYTRFGHALAKVLKNKKALIVASSDLSHYPHFDDAIKTDSKTLKAIASLDEKKIITEMQDQLNQNIPELVTCACGEAPILAAVASAKELGAASASIISYSNSGYNPVGDVNKVVGYGAVTISRGVQSPDNAGPAGDFSNYRLTDADKEKLLEYARKTLAQYFWTQTVPLPRETDSPLIQMKRGVFVTLTLNGQLRGCIGHMGEDVPLYTNAGAMALHAAFNDSRFDPLSPIELPKIRIEISVLTPFTKVKDAGQITLGRDGVLLKKGNYQAVFLPQVATETGWNKEMFLDQLCLKAGLKAGDWKDADLFTFQAEIFREKE